MILYLQLGLNGEDCMSTSQLLIELTALFEIYGTPSLYHNKIIIYFHKIYLWLCWQIAARKLISDI